MTTLRTTYVIATASIIVIAWIVWIVVAKPYSTTKSNNTGDNTWGEITSSTKALQVEFSKQNEQWETLKTYITNQLNTTTTQTTSTAATSTSKTE